MPPTLVVCAGRCVRLAGRRAAVFLRAGAAFLVAVFFRATVFLRAGLLRAFVFFTGFLFVDLGFLLADFLVALLRAEVVFLVAVFLRGVVFFAVRLTVFFFVGAVFFRVGLRLALPAAVFLRRVPVIGPTPVGTCLNRAFITEAPAECKPHSDLSALPPRTR